MSSRGELSSSNNSAPYEQKGTLMDRNTPEIMRIIDMLQENNEPVSLDGIYVCSYYSFKESLQEDLDILVAQGWLVRDANSCYTRNLSRVKVATKIEL
jgi:hypothetical protein